MSNDGTTPAERFRQAGTDMSGSDAEKFLWEGTYSGKAMMGQWIALAAATVVLGIVMVIVPFLVANPIAWAVYAIVVALGWVGLAMVFLYRKMSFKYELSSQRFKHRSGILTRTSDRIELIDIDDVIYRQGPIQAMLGVGNIEIKSSDASHPELTLYGIDRCKEVSDMIDDARRAERRKRGLHIETI